jgi:hypothetical protein
LGLDAVAVGLVVLVGALGPSAAVPDPAGGGVPAPAWLPPWSAGAAPAPELVSALLAVAVGAGVLGVARGVWALARGWAPDPRRLRHAGAAAAAAVCVVPPIGSADVLGYAAYGRMRVLGLDPYTTTPDDLARMGDPFGVAAERPWLEVPSVYGPIASWHHELAARIGGESVEVAVLVLAVSGAAAFVVTGHLLGRLAGDVAGPPAAARAALLWSVNPLLLLPLVAGVHTDALLLLPAVAALVVLRRSPFAAGALLGLAGGIKLSIGLWGLALLWSARRSPRTLAVLGCGALAALVPVYAAAGPAVLGAVRQAASFAGPASFWRLQRDRLELRGLDPEQAARLVAASSWLLVAAVVLLLALLAPRPLASRRPADPVPAAAVAVAVVSLAWLLAAPYTLPWYDAMVWAPLALLAPSVLDALVLARTATLLLAYVPGRAVVLPDQLERLTAWVRGAVAPVAAAALVAWAAVRAGLVVTGSRLPAPAAARTPPDPPS